MRPTPDQTTSQAPMRADGMAWPDARPSLGPSIETHAECVRAWTLGAIARARVELGLAPLERGAREVVACSPSAFSRLMRGERGLWGRECDARAIRRAVQAHRAAVAPQLVARPTAAAVAMHLAVRAMPTAEARAFLPVLGRRWHGASGKTVPPTVRPMPAAPAVAPAASCDSARTVDVAAERAAAQAESARRAARRLAERVAWARMVAYVLTSACRAPRVVVAVPPPVRLAAAAAHARSLVEPSPGALARRGNDVLASAHARI